MITTVLYLGPANPLSNIYKNNVDKYMSTLFTQSWELFGRNLSKNTPVILSKCDSEDEWYIHGYNLLDKHFKSRLLGYGKLYYLINSDSRNLFFTYIKNYERNLEESEIIIRTAQSSSYRKIVKLFLNLNYS